jgi:Phosphatidylglycerophosphate synthase
LIGIIALMDWLDGYLARRFRAETPAGEMLDTLGDRITENVLLVFFAYHHIIPLFVPLVFITRSFLSDFIRHINRGHGIDTFSVNRSAAGRILVSSRASRALYLAAKLALFFGGGAVIMLETAAPGAYAAVSLKTGLAYWSVFVLAFNVARFSLLLYDSRAVLRGEFGQDNNG